MIWTIMPLVAAFVMLVGPLLATAPRRGTITGQPVRVEETRYAMGCLYTIEAWGADPLRLRRVLNEALDEVDRLDRLLSHYQPESALSRLNRTAWPGPVQTDPELFDLLLRSLEYGAASGGAFDITLGPLMRAWGFFRGEGRYPTEKERRAAMARIGARHVQLDRRTGTVTFDRAGIELDLGGIGKGYAVDRVGDLLRRAGVDSALISAGGSSILAIGQPRGPLDQPDTPGWRVDLQDPSGSGKTALTLYLRDAALSVSGSAEKFFELNGRRYSHIMDPRSGEPVESVLAVAVVSRTGIDGDALDNAFFVLGPAATPELRRRYEIREVIFFLPAAGGWRMVRQ